MEQPSCNNTFIKILNNVLDFIVSTTKRQYLSTLLLYRTKLHVGQNDICKINEIPWCLFHSNKTSLHELCIEQFISLNSTNRNWVRFFGGGVGVAHRCSA